jgi:hypothetical protein
MAAPVKSVRRTVGRRPISAGLQSGASPRRGRRIAPIWKLDSVPVRRGSAFRPPPPAAARQRRPQPPPPPRNRRRPATSHLTVASRNRRRPATSHLTVASPQPPPPGASPAAVASRNRRSPAPRAARQRRTRPPLRITCRRFAPSGASFNSAAIYGGRASPEWLCAAGTAGPFREATSGLQQPTTGGFTQCA